MKRDAVIYIRRNGSYGAQCDNVFDTDHHITEDSGYFTVTNSEGDRVCYNLPQAMAEAAITADWRSRNDA